MLHITFIANYDVDKNDDKNTKCYNNAFFKNQIRIIIH